MDYLKQRTVVLKCGAQGKTFAHGLRVGKMVVITLSDNSLKVGFVACIS